MRAISFSLFEGPQLFVIELDFLQQTYGNVTLIDSIVSSNFVLQTAFLFTPFRFIQVIILN